jgi:hypothetical protein
MIYFIKKIKILLLLLLLCSCSKHWYKPFSRVFKNMPKGGSPGFELGWQHGCESGLGTQFGGAIYQTFYTWKRDVDITSSTNIDQEIIRKIRKRYEKELKGINWDNISEVKKNFSDYNTIFWTASAFCRHSLLGILQTAGMTPTLPGDDRYDPTAHSVGSIWKINGKGDARYAAGGLW